MNWWKAWCLAWAFFYFSLAMVTQAWWLLLYGVASIGLIWAGKGYHRVVDKITLSGYHSQTPDESQERIWQPATESRTEGSAETESRVL